MALRNQSTLTEFTLVSFPVIQELQILLFVVLLLVYMLTITGNTVIISLIWTDNRLQTPMYFFLSNLSFWGHFVHNYYYPKVANLSLRREKNHIFCWLHHSNLFLLLSGESGVYPPGGDVL